MLGAVLIEKRRGELASRNIGRNSATIVAIDRVAQKNHEGRLLLQNLIEDRVAAWQPTTALLSAQIAAPNKGGYRVRIFRRRGHEPSFRSQARVADIRSR